VKNNKLTKVVLITSLVASSAVIAESDYPATDFQPKVVYSDSEYKHSSDAPATGSSAASKQSSKSVATESDENYPATNYQPKVLFSDADYKHSSSAPSVGGSSVKSSKPTSASALVEVVQTEKAASSNFSYIGLIALAIAGFFIYNKKSGAKSSKQSVRSSNSVVLDYTASADATTGVEKYLEKLIDVNKTGVAKYLEKQTSTPSTGVAKYMAKQIVKDREAAATKATGVEKYLRDNG